MEESKPKLPKIKQINFLKTEPNDALKAEHKTITMRFLSPNFQRNHRVQYHDPERYIKRSRMKFMSSGSVDKN